MQITKIEEHINLIDVQTLGIKNFIASYILKGRQTAILETGPASSVPNLLSGLKELKVKPEDVAYVAVSHIHLDHAGGVGKLLKYLPNAKVIVADNKKNIQELKRISELDKEAKEIVKEAVTATISINVSAIKPLK